MGLFEQANVAKDHNGSPDAGSGSAVVVSVPVSTEVDVYYDVGASTDAIKIEGNAGNGWRELDETVASGSVTTGGDVVSVSTAYGRVRAYAGSGFANADVNELEISAEGV